MASEDDSGVGAHEQAPQRGVAGSYLFPVLATITAMSVMSAAAAIIGVWKDFSLIRQSMDFLVKTNETQQKEYKEHRQKTDQTLHDHEIRLTKGKL